MEDIIGDFPLEEIAERYHYIDWLRIIVMLVVFFFHNAWLFDYEAWLIKNDHLFVSFSILTRFTSQRTMPLSFLVAGANSYFLMRSKM